MIKDFICVVCPRGCALKVRGEKRQVEEVLGHHCARGAKYASEEFVDPRRVLSSSVALEGAERRMLPVRSAQPVPRDRLLELATLVRTLRVKAPVTLHQVVAADLGHSGVDLIASMAISEER